MKKTKIIAVVLLAFMLCFSLLAMTACGCDHTFTGWKTTIPSTCEKNGEQERICTKCQQKETRIIETNGHFFVNGVCVECGKTGK